MVRYNLEYIKNENERNEVRKYFKNYYRSEALKVMYVDNGIILPRKEADKVLYPNTWMGLGGVLDNYGNFIKMSGIKALYSDDLAFGGKYNYTSIQECSEMVLYMGVFQPQWGHFLEEYCTRLWFYLKNEVSCKIAYCGFNCKQGDISGSFEDFFTYLGIKKEQLIDIRKPTRFKKIIIPEQSFLRLQYYTDDYKNIINTVYKNGVKNKWIPYKNIYLSRVDFVNKNTPEKEHGEQEIQETFRKNGYQILEPEKLSVEEQMFYIRNCQVLVSTLGSVSSNAVFASNEAKIIYIRKGDSVVPETFQIDQMINVKDVTFIDCFFKPYRIFPFSYGSGPHFIGVTKEFKKFIKTNKMKLLNSHLYYYALMKNWIWITSKFGKTNLIKQIDTLNEYKIRKKINNIIKQGKTKFIIYPYGRLGCKVKNILDEKIDVICLCVDHYKFLENNDIYDIDIFKNDEFSDYNVLICSDKKSSYHKEILEFVHCNVEEKKRIINI